MSPLDILLPSRETLVHFGTLWDSKITTGTGTVVHLNYSHCMPSEWSLCVTGAHPTPFLSLTLTLKEARIWAVCSPPPALSVYLKEFLPQGSLSSDVLVKGAVP